ncbi:MAG: capsule biosynthesis protein [Sphingomonadales bacterium]|nr:capsule biosynthesis protein [Sphingomonadales bacterium]
MPRRLYWLRRHPWFLVVVVLPVLLATIYYGFIASDEYVSESRFVIHAPDQRQAQTTLLANLVQTSTAGQGQQQTDEVIDYMRSRSGLADLMKRIDVRARFESPDADFLSRYPLPFQSDRFERLHRYYDKMIDVRIDKDTNSAVLTVKAFTGQDAHDLNANLLDISEDFVNRLNQRAEHHAVAEAERRVAIAEDHLRDARLALRAYRNSAEVLDPGKQATGVIDVSNQLVMQEATLRAQLELTQRVAPRNPSLPALRQRVDALSQQVAAQNGRAVGTSSGLASKLSDYEKLSVEQDLATQMLSAAEASLEQARNEAQRQQFYLERVVEPNTPDMPTLPKRLAIVLEVAATVLCLYFIGWMLVVGIIEHAPEH